MKKKIFVILTLFVASFSIVVSAITKKEAQTLVEGRHYTEAIEALRTLMKQSAYAKDGECNKLLGQSLCMTGRYKEALAPLETAIRQNRRSGAQWYLAITRQHLYDFDGALEAIEAYRPVLKSEVWIERADSLEAECVQGQRAMNHVEDIEIIDSLFVSKHSFLKYFNLGPESGRFLYDEENGFYFENQASDYRIFAEEGSLSESYKIQNNWEEKRPINGIGSMEYKLLSPFMRADGETLYFACDSTPGLGGLDIYKTRLNSEDGSFYLPERLGMPFNSPFDDYMMAIDETHQVGWWATDRGDDPERILIYVFKLNDAPAFLDEASVSRARIDRIAESWKSADGYAALKESIANAKLQPVKKEYIEILINDRLIYHSPDQFKNKIALSWYEQSLKTKKAIEENEAQLKDLRERYATSSSSQKSQLAGQIRQAEDKLYSLYQQYHEEEKKMRNLEAK